jgi:hypothetical protein
MMTTPNLKTLFPEESINNWEIQWLVHYVYMKHLYSKVTKKMYFSSQIILRNVKYYSINMKIQIISL